MGTTCHACHGERPGNIQCGTGCRRLRRPLRQRGGGQGREQLRLQQLQRAPIFHFTRALGYHFGISEPQRHSSGAQLFSEPWGGPWAATMDPDHAKQEPEIAQSRGRRSRGGGGAAAARASTAATAGEGPSPSAAAAAAGAPKRRRKADGGEGGGKAAKKEKRVSEDGSTVSWRPKPSQAVQQRMQVRRRRPPCCTCSLPAAPRRYSPHPHPHLPTPACAHAPHSAPCRGRALTACS